MTRSLCASFCSGLALAIALVAGLPAAAQEPKSRLLEEARKAQEIATQRAEADLRATLGKVNMASAAEALTLLKQAVSRLENDDEINPERKAAMLRMLKDRVRTHELAAGSPRSDDKPIADASKEARLAARRKELESQAAEREKIKAAITGINQLQGQGRTEEAERQAQDLAQKFPDSPAARAMGRKGFMNARVREAKDILADQDKRHIAVMNEVQKGSIPLAGDVEFDKKVWALASKRGGAKLTDKEKALLKALNEPVQANWRNSRFEDVIEHLSTASGQPIVIDKKALEDQNLTYDSPVTFVAPKPIAMRSALRKVLQDNGLTYVIKDELIYVTTVKAARDMMVTRVYPLADIVSLGFWADGTLNHPVTTMQAEAKAAELIVEAIRDSIEPMSWQGNGGSATIRYEPVTKSLIVRQSAEVHMMLKSGLK